MIRRHGDAYRSAHPVDRSAARAMGAMTACRTAALGGHVERCDAAACGFTRISYNSCRNRHCTKCQSNAARDWLAERSADLLPVEYFHVVFTMPAPVAAIAKQNKAVVYGLLFEVTAETLKTIAADPRHLGAETGATMVLHTWGQTLTYHPHVHVIVPGGGLSRDGTAPVASGQTEGASKMDRLSPWFLPASQGSAAALSPPVLAKARRGPRQRPSAVL